jgi:hypothetical protein
MAVNISDLKKAVLDVRHSTKDMPNVILSVPIPMKTAKALIDCGAKKSMRKSERGGEYDTLVVRLSTDAFVAAQGKSNGSAT